MAMLDLNFVIDGVPYSVKAKPYEFNNEKRFIVAYDGNEYVFAYDSNIGKYASIGEGTFMIPDPLETVVAEKLENI